MAPRCRASKILAAGIVALLVLLAVVVYVAKFRSTDPGDGGTPTGRGNDAYVQESSGAINVPGDFQSEKLSFEAGAGRNRWVTARVDAVMPESGANAAFLRLNLHCTDSNGSHVISQGGTENILKGEDTQFDLSSPLLLDEHAGEVECWVEVAAPNEEAAAIGDDVQIETYMGVSDSLASATDIEASSRLPHIVQEGTSAQIYSDVTDIPDDSEGMETSAVLHMTSCTIQNGSRDAQSNRNLCRGSYLNEEGSSIDAVLSQTVIDAEGNKCAELPTQTLSPHISYHQHHYLLTLRNVMDEMPTCGDKVKSTVTVSNSGPAALLIHSRDTNLGLGFPRE